MEWAVAWASTPPKAGGRGTAGGGFRRPAVAAAVDREAVLSSVRKNRRALVLHERTTTAVSEASWPRHRREAFEWLTRPWRALGALDTRCVQQRRWRRSIRRGRASSPPLRERWPTERATAAPPPSGRGTSAYQSLKLRRAVDRCPRQGRHPRLHRRRLLPGTVLSSPPAQLGRALISGFLVSLGMEYFDLRDSLRAYGRLLWADSLKAS